MQREVAVTIAVPITTVAHIAGWAAAAARGAATTDKQTTGMNHQSGSCVLRTRLCAAIGSDHEAVPVQDAGRE
jgi:hypothetical protein